MKFETIEEVKEAYTLAKLQGYNKDIANFASEEAKDVTGRCPNLEHFILEDHTLSFYYALEHIPDSFDHIEFLTKYYQKKR